MSLQPNDKKALGIAAAVIAAMVVVIAVATTLLVRGTDKPLPEVSLQTGRDYERLAPTFWCDVKLAKCTPRALSQEEIALAPVARFPVAVGDRLTLSVPSSIATGPWTLIAAYATPKGIEQVNWIHMPGSTFTQILQSRPGAVLLGLQIESLSAVVSDPGPGGAEAGIESGQGDILVRGHYAVDTVPAGFTPSSTVELPPRRG